MADIDGMFERESNKLQQRQQPKQSKQKFKRQERQSQQAALDSLQQNPHQPLLQPPMPPFAAGVPHSSAVYERSARSLPGSPNVNMVRSIGSPFTPGTPTAPQPTYFHQLQAEIENQQQLNQMLMRQVEQMNTDQQQHHQQQDQQEHSQWTSDLSPGRSMQHQLQPQPLQQSRQQSFGSSPHFLTSHQQAALHNLQQHERQQLHQQSQQQRQHQPAHQRR
jgi:hypothetical protein